VPALLAFGLPLLASFAVVVWHNLVRFGSLFDEGYTTTEEGFTTPLWTGLAGLLLSPGKSLFLYVPLAALALVGWRHFWREQRAVAAFWSGLIAITLLQTALWWAWWGGWSWGPRLLVPLLPFIVLSLGPLLRASRAARLAFVPLALAGMGVALLGVLVDFNPYLAGLMVEYPGERVGTENPGIYFDPALSPILAHARFLLAGEHSSVITFDLERLGFSTGFESVFWVATGFLFLAGVSLLVYVDRLYSWQWQRDAEPVSRAEPTVYTS
jgi:hypothetical protein